VFFSKELRQYQTAAYYQEFFAVKNATTEVRPIESFHVARPLSPEIWPTGSRLFFRQPSSGLTDAPTVRLWCAVVAQVNAGENRFMPIPIAFPFGKDQFANCAINALGGRSAFLHQAPGQALRSPNRSRPVCPVRRHFRRRESIGAIC
jgi:hypothetical protein